MIHVVISYDFIELQMFGVISDAGGGNLKKINLLQIWSCKTNTFKAMRNNL